MTPSRDSPVTWKCGFPGEETPRLFQQIWHLKFKNLHQWDCSKALPGLQSCDSAVVRVCLEPVGSMGYQGPSGAGPWPPSPPCGSVVFPCFFFPSPPAFHSLWLMETRAGELSLTIFPNTEPKKCCGGARSIFEEKAVNVKPVLIYSGEL